MRRTRIKALAALAVAAVVTSMAAASSAGANPDRSAPDQGADRAAAAIAELVASGDAALLISPHDVLTQVGVHEGTYGMRFFEFERTHRGLPVVGGDFVVATDRTGAIAHIAVAQDRVLDVDPQPQVASSAAVATARAEVAVPGFATAPRLVVLAWGTPRLAWEVGVDGTSADGMPTSPIVYVDAITGEVAESYDRIQYGVGNGFYNGTVTINTSGSGSSFSMIDPTRPGIRCTNANGTTFTGNDDVWGNGSGTNLETACVDALYAVQRQWDMLAQWLNRNGINGSGGGFPARVGLTIVNAFWNGSSASFGRSSDGQRQLTPMDIVAHEFGHGIFQTTPGGSGSGGTGNEKGGLNESTGDIMGALTEAFADNPNDPPDFLVGEEANLNGTGPIRFMYDPSQRNQPNCWSSAIPNTEVHAAGGPLNHWFYLVSQGSNPAGGPASPICSGGPSSVTGIGIVQAGQIFYNALLMKTTSWRYVNVRQASMAAVVSMFGSNSQQCVTVKGAWDAVSVPQLAGEPSCGGTPPPPPPPPPPPGGTIYQDSFETSTGWTLSGNATSGVFQRAVPQQTSNGGVVLQLGTVPHGSLVAVTGAAAGGNAGANDVDGGATIITSPLISIPSSGNINLVYEWTFAHLNNATSADFFRTSIISGGSTTVVHNVAGAATNRAGNWQTANISLNQFRGSSIRIRIEVADAGSASLIEGAVDNVRIIQS